MGESSSIKKVSKTGKPDLALSDVFASYNSVEDRAELNDIVSITLTRGALPRGVLLAFGMN